ncbi:hypothetical protein Trydic_g12773 [Trypoxylus dichotomus]
MTYFPHFICTNSSTRKEIIGNAPAYECSEGIGLEAELLKEMSTRLNFTYKLVNFGDNSSKSYLDVFKKVENGTIDFAIGSITRTRKRAKTASFTTTIDTEQYNLFYLYRMSDFNSALTFMYPFEYNVWIGIVILIFGLSTLLWFYVYVKKLKNGFEEMRWFEYFILFYKSILEEAAYLRAIAFSGRNWFRILWIFWCFYCALTASFYRSKMASIMARPHHTEPNLVEDILDQGYNLVLETRISENVLGILENNDTFTKRVASHVVFRKGWCNALRFALENPAAMIVPFQLIQYNSQWHCRELFGPTRTFMGYKPNDLRISRKYVISAPLGWPLLRGVPYKDSFNKIIAKCRQCKFKA